MIASYTSTERFCWKYVATKIPEVKEIGFTSPLFHGIFRNSATFSIDVIPLSIFCLSRQIQQNWINAYYSTERFF